MTEEIAAPTRTDPELAKRRGDFVRTIPTRWTDSDDWPEAELESVAGFLESRYRVNTPDRFYIVQGTAVAVSFEMIERLGIKDATTCFLIAVRSLLGEDFPDIMTDGRAKEILRLNRQFTEDSRQCGLQIEAVYVNGKCERTGREFRFEDWIAEPEAAETRKTDCHPLSPVKEKWPGEDYARDAIIRLKENPELQKNISAFCREIAKEQGVPEIASSLKKLLYVPEYKRHWKL